MPAIGIDLGTTNSCAFIVEDEKPKVIINKNGKHTTPSVIGLWNTKEAYIGVSAIKMVHKYPKSVVTGVKYNMGKKYDVTSTNNKMLINDNNQLKYSITREEIIEYFLPEELSAKILKALKLYAEEQLNKDVVKAVITVPTYFNDLQREATIAAGKIAGFKEIKLLNESVAAAVAYGMEHKQSNNKIIFIFDFGGGTLDVSILKYFNDKFDVLAIDGDLHLGGDDITNVIFEYIVSQIDNFALTNKNRFQLRLTQLCEDAKITLSSQDEYSFDLPEHTEDLLIIKEKFNELTNNLFDKIMLIVKRCLENAKLSTNQIDDIVLVGGSSRIPAIQDRLIKFFNKELKKTINPDEVVAQGASIVAANWNKTGFKNLKLNTVTSHSIGIELMGKDMLILIPRNSKLPTQKSIDNVCPLEKDQTDARLNIFSGEDLLTKNNTSLGSLDVLNIAIDPRSNIRTFSVILKITVDGVLNVTTMDNSHRTENTTIILDKNNLNETQIKAGFVKLNAEQIK